MEQKKILFTHVALLALIVLNLMPSVFDLFYFAELQKQPCVFVFMWY